MGKPSPGIGGSIGFARFRDRLLKGFARTAALARKRALTFDQHSPMGDKSGAYGGRET
jgi:hypothetical protein